MPPSSQWESQKETSGFVTVIKNYGAPVGGSLEHGHQQIGWNNIMPRSYYNNWCFYNRHDMYFSEYMLRENPLALTVKEYGQARLIVPYFMKRPYNLLLLFHDVGKQYLCELDPEELDCLGDALNEVTRLYQEVMPRIGKELAYNVVFHNGPGAGFYVEFLPYTQETGGFEHLGLWVCQSMPELVAENLKSLWPEVIGAE
jgi:galactose-1-phosphate uridylyltransferase